MEVDSKAITDRMQELKMTAGDLAKAMSKATGKVKTTAGIYYILSERSTKLPTLTVMAKCLDVDPETLLTS
jgi:hypothetical protein